MNKPNISTASDYAIMDCKIGSFYYGYEITSGEDEEWCFEAKFNNQEIKIPFSDLGSKDMFDVRENLMLGIGWIFAKYDLKQRGL